MSRRSLGSKGTRSHGGRCGRWRVVCPWLPILIAMVGSALGVENAFRATLSTPAMLGGRATSHGAFISLDPVRNGCIIDLVERGLPPRAGLDALAVTNALVYFSTDVDVTLGTTHYANEDILAYDLVGRSFTSVLAGATAGIPREANVDAVALMVTPAGTNLLLSIDMSCTLGSGQSVNDKDVLLVGPASPLATRLYSGVDDLKIPARADLDALFWTGEELLFSLDVTATISSQTGDDSAIWSYSPTTGQIALQPLLYLDERLDITGLDRPIDSDGDLLTDLEELTGLDEAATVYPGSSTPLDPQGYVSDPLLADTDGDGYLDGIEAATGTDPSSQASMLMVTAPPHPGTNTQQLGWVSAPGRFYRIWSAPHPTGPYTDAYGARLPASPNTNYTYLALALTNTTFYRVTLDP